MSEKMTFNAIQVVPEDVSGNLYLRESLASGEFGPHHFEVTRPVSSMAFIVECKDVKVMINLREAVKEIVEKIVGAEGEDEQPSG